MKHWEFTGEEKNENGVILKRIRATISFYAGGDTEVERGTQGGWIEKNENLFDNAWVSGDACVFGNALVSGNAWLSNGTDYFLIGPIGSRNDRTTFTRDKNGEIYVSCGCFYGSIHAFREIVKQTYGDGKHARTYLAAADLAEIQIGITPITGD